MDDDRTIIESIKTLDDKIHVPHLDEEKNLLIPLPWKHGALYYMIPRELIVEMVKGE